MKKHFDIQRITRNNVLTAIEGLSLEQINNIPENFNNSIGWNLTHIVTTHQLLVYGLSGLELNIDVKWVEPFRKGAPGNYQLSGEELDSIKELLVSLPNKCEDDYSKGIFTEYKEYTTSYNITLTSAEEAIMFNNVHEGLHYGYIMALKKLV